MHNNVQISFAQLDRETRPCQSQNYRIRHFYRFVIMHKCVFAEEHYYMLTIVGEKCEDLCPFTQDMKIPVVKSEQIVCTIISAMMVRKCS